MIVFLKGLWMAAPAKLRLLVGFGLLVGVALMLAYCQGRGAGKAGEKLKQAEGAARVDRAGDKADATAADARVEDTRQGAKEAKELEDATRDAESADDARRRRGCAIMRQQGLDISQIPACR